MTHTARGEFVVTLKPLEFENSPPESRLGRMSIDKQFTGDLDAHSIGMMLSAMTATKGSAGYVAVERVEGTLHGKRGSFVLQHSGVMARGAQSLTVSVVPDSGTDELVGLEGELNIIIDNGRHSYEFRYHFPAAEV